MSSLRICASAPVSPHLKPFHSSSDLMQNPASWDSNFRQGDGISETTRFDATDKYGKALFMNVRDKLETRFLISGMADRDQQILAGILQNVSRIVRDAIEGDEKLSKDDRDFWIGSSALFDSHAKALLEALQSPAWNPK